MSYLKATNLIPENADKFNSFEFVFEDEHEHF